MNQIQSTLKELGFKTNEIKVYLGLTLLGEAVASRVAKKVNLPRTTVISILNLLTERGFVSCNTHRGAKYYWVESPQALEGHFLSQAQLATSLKDQLRDLYRHENAFPTAQVYDTKESIKNFIKNTISSLPRGTVIKTFDSPHRGDYTKILSDDTEFILLDQKTKNNLQTRTLISVDTEREINPNKIKRQPIEVRFLPKGVEFTSSFWVLPDKIVFFSGHPPFITAISHPEIIKSWESVFDYFWEVGKNA